MRDSRPTCCIFDGLQWNSQRGLGRFSAQLARHIDRFGWHRLRSGVPKWKSPLGRIALNEIVEPARRMVLRPDIAVFPHNVLPTLSSVRRSLNVFVLHDLLFTTGDNKTAGNVYRNFALRHSLVSADFIITVSEASRSAIRTVLPKETPIAVISNALAESFAHPRQSAAPVTAGERQILHFGGSAPSKNTAAVLGAIRILKNNGHRFHLLLASMTHNFHIVDRWAREATLTREDFTILPSLSDAELIKIFLQAQIHCMPSTGEGFGIPVIEAARCNLANVLTPLPVFRELIGDNAIFSEGFSADEIAGAIHRCSKEDTANMLSAAKARTDCFLFDAVHEREAIPALSSIERLCGRRNHSLG